MSLWSAAPWRRFWGTVTCHRFQSGAKGVHVSKCTAGVPPARGRLAGREDEGGRDARGTLWATHLL
ncbi:MAG: hypothetical protein ABSE73_32580, partial [Planctomycetota bacterium]